MNKLILPYFLVLLSFTGVFNPNSLSAKSNQIDFIENKGQWSSESRFKADIPGGVMFLTDKGFVYHYVNNDDLQKIHDYSESQKDYSKLVVHHHAYKVNFVGVNDDASFSPSEKRSNYNNYFIGNDRSRWKGKVGLYGKVTQANIYNGIDVTVYSNNESTLKYDFFVAPGANPDQIRLSFEGVQPRVTKDGDLLIKTSVNSVIEKAPYTYQVIDGRKVTVRSKYSLNNNVLSFNFPDGYNSAYPLVIDPNLEFATYSAASGSNTFYAHSSTYDKDGYMYAGALGDDLGWPVTAGAFQATGMGGFSASVSINKYSPDGSTLIYSTYFAGSGTDEPSTMRVNDQNQLVVVGPTTSSDLPTTTGAYDSTFNGGTDIFVAHFNYDGSDLVGCTYVGGSGTDPTVSDIDGTSTAATNGAAATSAMEVIFDESSNIWVVSNSNSNNFPVTSNALQSTNAGNYDGVLFQLDSTCSNLIYSTYIGGSNHDAIANIGFTSDKNIVICGLTQSTDFPTTSGTLHSTAPGGGMDGFVSVLNPSGTAFLSSSYLGTSSKDVASKLQIDCADNIYVLGRTQGNYPVSSGVWSMPGTNVYIDKINPTLTTSLLSTRLGSPGFVPTAMLLDICGNIYISGVGYGLTNMPLTEDAFDSNQQNFWFCALEPNFADLLFGTYFGTSADHIHQGTYRFDPQGIVYHSVCSTSQTFPTTPGSWSPNKQNGYTNDIVSFKFNFDAVSIKMDETSSLGGNDTIPHCIRGCKSAYFNFSRKHADTIPLTIRYLVSGSASNGQDYQLIPDSIVIPAYDSVASLEIKPLLVQNMPTGVKDVIISALSPCGCENGSDNIVAVGRVLIYDSLYVKIPTLPDTVCSHTEITINAEIDSTLNFEWQPAALIPDPYPQGLSIHPTPVGTTSYSITVTQPGAPATCPPHTVSYQAVVEQYPQIIMPAKDTIVCINPSDSINLNAYATPEGVNYNFHWTPATYLRDDFSANNKFSAPVGDYHYTFSATSPWAACYGEDSMIIHVVPPFSFTSVSPVDTTIKYGDEVQLDARGEAIAWLWLPVTYLNEPTLQSPIAQPLENMIYQVVGLDKYGCRDTAEVKINVEYQSNTFVPTAFSPNGDGLNDVLKVLNLQFDRLVEFKIYNRTGQLVFETHNPQQGWDGTYNGKPAAMDTYFYQLKTALPNGGGFKTHKGDVSLIR